MKICVNLLTHWDSVGAQKQQNRCRSIVRVLKCLCRGGVVFASCWSSVHVRLDFPLKAMQIYAFSVESPNKIGYFFWFISTLFWFIHALTFFYVQNIAFHWVPSCNQVATLCKQNLRYIPYLLKWHLTWHRWVRNL